MMRGIRNRAIFAKLAIWVVGVYFFAPTLHMLTEFGGQDSGTPIAGMCSQECKIPWHHHPKPSTHDERNCLICKYGHSALRIALAANFSLPPEASCDEFAAPVGHILASFPTLARPRSPPV